MKTCFANLSLRTLVTEAEVRHEKFSEEEQRLQPAAVLTAPLRPPGKQQVL